MGSLRAGKDRFERVDRLWSDNGRWQSREDLRSEREGGNRGKANIQMCPYCAIYVVMYSSGTYKDEEEDAGLSISISISILVSTFVFTILLCAYACSCSHRQHDF